MQQSLLRDLPVRLTWVKQSIYDQAIRSQYGSEENSSGIDQMFEDLDLVFSPDFFTYVCNNEIKSLQQFFQSKYYSSKASLDQTNCERVLATYAHMVFEEVAHSQKINQMIDRRL